MLLLSWHSLFPFVFLWLCWMLLPIASVVFRMSPYLCSGPYPSNRKVTPNHTETCDLPRIFSIDHVSFFNSVVNWTLSSLVSCWPCQLFNSRVANTQYTIFQFQKNNLKDSMEKFLTLYYSCTSQSFGHSITHVVIGGGSQGYNGKPTSREDSWEWGMPTAHTDGFLLVFCEYILLPYS